MGFHATAALLAANAVTGFQHADEFALADKAGFALAAGFRAAEAELPTALAALGDFLGTVRLIADGQRLGVHLRLAQADAHTLTAQLHALGGKHVLHHFPLFRRQVLQLFEHLVHARHLLAINLDIAAGELPETGLNGAAWAEREKDRAVKARAVSRRFMDGSE